VRDAGLADDTLIVLVSDHGEGFFIHSYAGQKLGWHGSSLYDEVLRVPLAIIAPGLEPRVVDQPVMLIDLAPTLLELLKAPVPKDFQGRSLKPLLFGEPLTPRPVHAELIPYPGFDHAMTALVTPEGTKVIWFEGDRQWEVFDLKSDPEELKDLSDVDPALVKQLKGELGGWIDSGRR
jgi:choline-sulfatase